MGCQGRPDAARPGPILDQLKREGLLTMTDQMALQAVLDLLDQLIASELRPLLELKEAATDLLRLDELFHRA